MKAFLELIDVGSIDVSPLITHEFPIKEALKAYELISGKGEAPYTGVLLTYPDSPAAFPERQITLQDVSRPTESGVKLGVLGAGNFASTVMLPAIKRVAGIELVGIVSASGRSATQAGKRFNFNYAATDAEKMIQDDDLNTLAILTRHHQHAPYVIAGLKAGKHVFCEKPLALDHAELNEIQTVLATSSRLLTVGFNRRFAPHTKRLRALLRTSKAPLAMQYRINAGVLPATHWLHDPEQGGGRIVGEVCHFIDLLAFLCDSLPASVSASALPTVGDYIEDNVSMTLTFEDGSIGTVSYFANGDRSLPKERLEVFQSGRVGILDDFRNLTWIADGRKRAFKSRLRQDKGHQGEWEAFVNAILHTQEPPIPYDQLFAVTRATFAAVQALRSGDPVSITTL